MPALNFTCRDLDFDKPNENPELRDRWEWLFAIFSDYVQPDSSISLDEAIKRAAQ
jgi:hypothetical protein